MHRRTFCQTAFLTSCVSPAMAAFEQRGLEAAAAALSQAVHRKQVRAAALLVRQEQKQFGRTFGEGKSLEDMFLIASISKPMSIAAVMTLVAEKALALEDAVSKFLPEFRGEGREKITLQQLCTHTCGLPDQLPENTQLRKRHAPLSEFVRGALRTPLLFAPGTKYRYSSMGILLAAEVAQRITNKPFDVLLDERVFAPLDMRRSALGLGEFKLQDLVACQVEDAAPESGAGDPSSTAWDWNSPYWRQLGSPWGGVHASAEDVAKFLSEFLRPNKLLPRHLARAMIENRNPAGLRPRGLGFALGSKSTSPGCSEQAFGHGGSTGTLAWADPRSNTVCVVLTTLPGRAAAPHPRELASDAIAKAVR